ncbi:MAG: hypothetical protein J7M14_07635, partial [Planctomycetes bacterium]|nr:hypothetical protein [Planctomycetota bacterium]
MALVNKRKAAMLLMGLEPATAAELLKAAEPQAITEIAAELALLDSSGYESVSDEEPAREFFSLLGKGRKQKQEEEVSFVKKVVEGAFDSQKSAVILDQVEHIIQLRDPFKPVRASRIDKLAEALSGESPQVAAMVLAELPPKKSISLLEMLGEDVRTDVVCGMATGDTVAAEAKLRVAMAIQERLVELEKGEAPEMPGGVEAPSKPAAPKVEVPQETQEEKLRRVALLLRGLKSAQKQRYS